jgi:hypothetical protein
MVNETICELNAPKLIGVFATKVVTVLARPGPVTLVIPSGETLTEYALAESEKLGGKSYFKLFGNPIEEVGKFIFYIFIILLI